MSNIVKGLNRLDFDEDYIDSDVDIYDLKNLFIYKS